MANNGDPDQTALCIVCIGHFDKNFGICKFKNGHIYRQSDQFFFFSSFTDSHDIIEFF